MHFFGDAARYFRKADQFAECVANRVDHNMGQEPCAILAHAPAFVLKFSIFQCCFQGTVRKANCQVFLSIKPRKMVTYNFGGGVALEPLRPAFQLSTVPSGVSM